MIASRDLVTYFCWTRYSSLSVLFGLSSEVFQLVFNFSYLLRYQPTRYNRTNYPALKSNQSCAGTIAPSPNHFSDRSNSLVAIWFDIPPSKHQHKILNILNSWTGKKWKLTSYLLRSQKLSSSSRCLDIVSVVIGGSS